MNEKMNEKINPAHDNTQKAQSYKPYATALECQKQYLIDTMQREHSAEWWSVVFAFVSHYKEA